MSYKTKFLKYQNKYLKLKGGAESLKKYSLRELTPEEKKVIERQNIATLENIKQRFNVREQSYFDGFIYRIRIRNSETKEVYHYDRDYNSVLVWLISAFGNFGDPSIKDYDDDFGRQPRFIHLLNISFSECEKILKVIRGCIRRLKNPKFNIDHIYMQKMNMLMDMVADGNDQAWEKWQDKSQKWENIYKYCTPLLMFLGLEQLKESTNFGANNPYSPLTLKLLMKKFKNQYYTTVYKNIIKYLEPTIKLQKNQDGEEIEVFQKSNYETVVKNVIHNLFIPAREMIQLIIRIMEQNYLLEIEYYAE